MDYCSLEDAWGVKTFTTANLPPPPADHHHRWREPVPPGEWPVSGPFGYRPPARNVDAAAGIHPVSACYLNHGVDGVLRALPQQAIEDLRARLAVNNLNVVAGGLLLGFILLILWDVVFRRR